MAIDVSHVRTVLAAASLVDEVRACSLCAAHLPLGPRPVLQLHPAARILIAAQAPGRKVHETGVPFNDASGARLRSWLGLTPSTFYNPELIAIVPMAFCYPGKGPSGDMPPRPECAARWRAPVLGTLKQLRLTLVIGRYALAYHLPEERAGLTHAVRNWRRHGPAIIPLPHPSPTNNGWMARNAWFERELVPALRARVAEILPTGASPASAAC
jgi:uracil-DNA glycosylase